MAGSPKKRAEMVRLNDHEERIFEALDEGLTQAAIAAELGVMRSSLARWLNANAERKAALKESRAIAGDAIAEETLDIADGVKGIDNAEVQAAKLRIEARMKLAAVWNAEKYGEQKAGVTINVGLLHLDALRQAQTAAPALQAVEVLPALAEPAGEPLSIDGRDYDAEPLAQADAFGLM
jgi:transcriptional regulator with XRE-family HTH domain